VPRATFYRWYEQYQRGGPEALEDRPSQPSRVWNRISPQKAPAALGIAVTAIGLTNCNDRC
jgi:putative transposase